ncbi:MAG: DUF3037 domain-containing protein [Chitinophagaceae bacterium]|nr:DUF3037 domain-containing protein [Chitinophagaceae bacterium]
MTKYQYQIIRYLPDHFTGEFANIGIIIYAPERNFLSCRVTSRYSRLTEFFGEVPGTFLMSSLKHIESKIKSIGEDFNGLLIYKKNTTSIIDITNTVIPTTMVHYKFLSFSKE